MTPLLHTSNYNEAYNMRMNLLEQNKWKKFLENAPKCYSVTRTTNQGHFFEGGTPNYIDNKSDL